MMCQTCGREGDCLVCCCVHPSHRGSRQTALPHVTTCPLCKHSLRPDVEATDDDA